MTSDALVASAGSPFQRGAGEFVEAERFGEQLEAADLFFADLEITGGDLCCENVRCLI